VDVRAHNRDVWDSLGSSESPWTRPVSTAQVEAARHGEWSIVVTPSVPVPRDWFPSLEGCRTLCLAGGGGQQGPILAAAGAEVTVLDFSEAQLARDEEVARRDGLDLTLVHADMTDLSRFEDHSFDLVVHPVASVYIPDVAPVWQEVARVLRPGGALIAGFFNPVVYVFDQDLLGDGELVVANALPYSELTSIDASTRQRLLDDGDPLQFSHTLADQIGGQGRAGLHVTDLLEDRRPGHPLAPYLPTHLATRAVRQELSREPAPAAPR